MLRQKNIKRISITKLSSKIKLTGMSVLSLEKKAGLNRNVIQNILKGKSKKPFPETIESICTALQCSEEDITSYFAEDEIAKYFEPGQKINKNLFLNCVKIANYNIDKITIDINFKEYMDIIYDTYAYSVENKLGDHIDENFVQWYIKKHFNIL